MLKLNHLDLNLIHITKNTLLSNITKYCIVQSVKQLIYLCNFNAPVLFLGLVRSSIVVPGAVVINQFPVPLSYTSLNEKGNERR